MECAKLVSLDDELGPPHSCTAVGMLQDEISKVRTKKIIWESYYNAFLITDDQCKYIINYDKLENAAQRDIMIKENPEKIIRVIVNLLNKISVEHTIQYLLTLIDEMLQEDKERVEIFRDYFLKIKDSMVDYFFGFFGRDNNFIVYQASSIVAKIACWSSQLIEEKDLQYFIQWSLDQLEIENNDYLHTIVRSLQMIMRMRQYRLVFVHCQGIERIVNVLDGKLNSQIQYQLIFCLWCLSFDADIVLQMVKTPRLIIVVSEVIRQCEREKIIRISLAFFRFLIEKLDNQKKVREVAHAMVHCKILKQLEILQQKNYSHDPELTDDLEYLFEKLSFHVQDVSSLEEYTIELKTGRLEWSPVHRAEKFWRENVEKFLDKNYELLKMLVRILESSKDAMTLQVAIHDIGEFARHYSRGKQVIEKLGGKGIVMDFLVHEDSCVKYQALLTLQKIMVNNWEYLEKKVDLHINQQHQKHVQ